MKTILIEDDLDKAADVLRAGGLVAVPTETVYGLAANGLSSGAVAKIYEVKGRPETKPISLLVSGMDDVEALCENIPESAYTLAACFWPGPLTMILPRKPVVPDVVSAGGATVGVRCPAHEKTLAIIKKAGVPLAAPSANLSGEPSPKNAQRVLEYFNNKIDCVVDGGQCTMGIESTIVDMTVNPPKVLRLGGLSAEKIAECANIEVTL